MKFTCEIKCSSEPFVFVEEPGTIGPGIFRAQALRQALQAIADEALEADSGTICDASGNPVGTWRIELVPA